MSLYDWCTQLVMNFRTDRVQERASMYTKSIKDKFAPLESFISFIYCTKILISRPIGPSSLHKEVCTMAISEPTH